MGMRYEDKLNKLTSIMFKVSLQLNNLFNFSILTENKKDKEKAIKEIKKIQKRCYKMIEQHHLNDYTGGTHTCCPGGSLDTYKPHTDKQNVLDMINYFFVNKGYANAKEFTKIVSPLVHEHEFGYSLGLNDYICNIEPKRFYNADCWQEFIRQGLKDISILNAQIPLSQDKINQINNQYSQALHTESNFYENSL